LEFGLSEQPVPPRTLHAGTAAVAVVFVVYGLSVSSWISRAPAVRDVLGVSSAQLGLLLLCMSGGSLAGLPLSGPIVHRVGTRGAVLAGAGLNAIGLAVLGTALLIGSVPVAVPGLVLIGVGLGVWDVGMNVEGAHVERALGRSLMPRLHAGFSLGVVVGAGLGAAAAAVALPVPVQVLAAAALVILSTTLAVRSFLTEHGGEESQKTNRASPWAAWREPRTVMLGLLVMGFAFTEGSANDWMAIAMVDGYRTSQTVGAVTFGIFFAAATLTRILGGWVLERFGRVATVRVTAIVALLGLLLVLLGGFVSLALIGAFLWGTGSALGFPVGMSAAADDPLRAAMRVSVVSSIGYTAYLAGPPLIGVLAEHIGILTALLVVTGALTLGLAASAAARPLPTSAPSAYSSRPVQLP
jgi:fucose permease